MGKALLAALLELAASYREEAEARAAMLRELREMNATLAGILKNTRGRTYTGP